MAKKVHKNTFSKDIQGVYKTKCRVENKTWSYLSSFLTRKVTCERCLDKIKRRGRAVKPFERA